MSRRIAWGAPVGSVLLGAVLIGITLSQGHTTLAKALQAMALLVIASVVMIALQTRSETARTFAGQTVDERWANIHRNSLAAAASWSIVIGVVAYAIVEVQGGENWQFALMIIATSLAYVVALAWYRWRS